MLFDPAWHLFNAQVEAEVQAKANVDPLELMTQQQLKKTCCLHPTIAWCEGVEFE